MKLEDFKRIIKTINASDQFIDDVQRMGIEIMDSPICDCVGILASELFTTVYGENGCDLVMEYLYKDVHKREVEVEGKNGKMYIDTLEELWEYLEKHHSA